MNRYFRFRNQEPMYCFWNDIDVDARRLFTFSASQYESFFSNTVIFSLLLSHYLLYTGASRDQVVGCQSILVTLLCGIGFIYREENWEGHQSTKYGHCFASVTFECFFVFGLRSQDLNLYRRPAKISSAFLIRMLPPDPISKHISGWIFDRSHSMRK